MIISLIRIYKKILFNNHLVKTESLPYTALSSLDFLNFFDIPQTGINTSHPVGRLKSNRELN
jgi:hypothetical protein